MLNPLWLLFSIVVWNPVLFAVISRKGEASLLTSFMIILNMCFGRSFKQLACKATVPDTESYAAVRSMN